MPIIATTGVKLRRRAEATMPLEFVDCPHAIFSTYCHYPIRVLRAVRVLFSSASRCESVCLSASELDVQVQFSWPDRTRPTCEFDPTRPRIIMKLWSRPNPTHLCTTFSFAIICRIFSLSTEWLFNSDANIIISRAAAFYPNNTSLMLINK